MAEPPQKDLEAAKRLMSALVRMPPKPHEEMKIGKKRKPGKPDFRPLSSPKKPKKRG